jgi:hypothetical protein
MSEQVLVFALSIERDYTLMEKRVKREVEQERQQGDAVLGLESDND